MKPSNVPNDAVLVPPSGGPFVTDPIGGMQRDTDAINHRNLADWKEHKIPDWLSQAGRDRDLGIAIRSKPSQYSTYLLNIANDLDEQGQPTDSKWVWNYWGGPLGDPCPDLPAIPARTAAVNLPLPVAITDMLPVPDGDIMPIGHVETAPDGALWQKVQSTGLFGIRHVFYKRIEAGK